MRTYKDIFRSYLEWLVEQTGDQQFDYDNFMSNHDEKVAKAFLFKSILELCYNKKNGIYYFCKFIIGDLLGVGYPNPFRYNSLLRSWDRLVRRADRIAILSARGHGKCQSPNSLVTLADGSRKKLIDMKAGDEIISFSDYDYKLEKDRIVTLQETEKKVEYLIKTNYGKSIVCADTHKFFTVNGWKELKDINIGDYIATPRNIPRVEEKTISNDEAFILGWLISEGRYNTSLEITQTNIDNVKSIVEACDRLGWNYKKTNEGVRISSKKFRFKELKFKNSYDKYIPEEMFKQPVSVIKSFLTAMIEGDGYVDSRNNTDMQISYSSMSKKLVDDLNHLFLILNIRGRIKISTAAMVTKRYNKKMPVYTLITSGNDCLSLALLIKLISKESGRRMIIEKLSNMRRNTNIDVIPKELIKKHYGKYVGHNWSREYCKKINVRYQSRVLNMFNSSDIVWEKVVSIDEGDELVMYDIQVAKNHNYIANDIITHNSVYFDQIINIYDMFLFKYKKIIIISSSQEQANSRLEELKTIIDHNEWLRTKKSLNKWATETIGYNSGYVLVKGIESEVLGQHVDRIVLDDILRSDNKISDIQIEDYIDMTLEPMLMNRKGQMIIVGTPKRESDIFTTIFNRKKQNPNYPWVIKRYPAILDYDKKILLCPDRFTWDDIIRKRLSMGALKFAREYQLEFFSRDTSLFQKHLLEPAKKKGSEMVLLNKFDKRPSQWLFAAGVDVARSGKVSADYSVVIIIAYNSISQEKQIVYMWRSKGLKITEQASQIAEISRRFDNPVFLVEKNNLGQDMIDELVDKHNLFIEEFVTGGKGQKKDELIRFLITAFEHEQIVIPRGDDRSRELMDILESELTKFCVTTTPAGNERFEGVGSHDDCLRKGARIKTITGIKNIEDVKVGDYVLTHMGRFRKVRNTIKKPFKGKAYEIKPFCSNKFTITYNHPILCSTRNGNTYKMNKETWVLPTDIKKHRLMYRVNREIKDIKSIDLLNYIPERDSVFQNYAKYNEKYIWMKENNKITRKIIVDEDFLSFIGLYLAEGSHNDANNNVSFGLNSKEITLRNFLMNYITNKLKIKAVEKVVNNTCCIYFSNVFWYNFFKGFGKKENKKLPSELGLEYLQPNLQLSILSGWMDGDGYTDTRGLNIGATISPHIANLMFDILLRNNINPNMRRIKRHRYKKRSKDQYWVEFKERFGNNRKVKLENNYRYSAIQHIKEVELDEEVYNLEVEEDESYVVEQTIVHNCVIALALANKATQSSGIPFAVTNFSGGNAYSSFVKRSSKHETELVAKIRMGLIK